MNGSQSWDDYPQPKATFVPNRLELMRNATEWVDNLSEPDNFTIEGARHLRIVEGSGLTDEYNVYIYDWFIQGLLTSGAYTDSDIYRAQWKWIQDETERLNTTKGDA
tara:strand:+ start:110 stop:430 length:321 start_codon:yes stop_codon:yes gene_type:complete